LIKSFNGITITGNDVIPAYQRGWYFKGQGTYATVSPDVVYGVNFSIELWMCFDNIASFTILEKVSDSTNLKLHVDGSDLKFTSKVESYNKHYEKSDRTSTLISGLIASRWYKFTINAAFSAGTTTIKVYLDDTLSNTITLSNSFMHDTESTLILSSTAASGTFYQGFIAYFITSNTSTLNRKLDVPASFPGCGLSTFPTYAPGTTSLYCANCPGQAGDCSIGCANSQTCSNSLSEVCTDLLCMTCATKFQICDTCKNLSSLNTLTGQCGCVSNATLDLTSKTCKCNFGYVGSSSSDRCIVTRDFLDANDIAGAVYNSNYTDITITLSTPIIKNSSLPARACLHQNRTS